MFPWLATLESLPMFASLSMDLLHLLRSSVGVAVWAMLLLAMLVIPAMRLSALVSAAVRWIALYVRRRPPRQLLAAEAEARPLCLAGLSAPLSRLVRQTRTLALELRRASAQASDWPAEPASPTLGWRETLLGGGGQPALTAVRDEVYAWLGLVEALPAADREVVRGLGVDVEAVRGALTAEARASEVVRALAGLLWSIDDRLAAASTSGYRAHGAEVAPRSHGRAAAGSREQDEDDARARRGRWAGTLAEHGPGLSRMAASYARSASEHEDLEQDIALALWRALPMFRGESSLKTFAYRVARYCCFRHVRRRRDADDALDPAVVADPAACVETSLLRADQRVRIEQALTELPDTLESVLSLHLTGHSYAQIAEALGISERNVSVRLSRARARLRQQLVAA